MSDSFSSKPHDWNIVRTWMSGEDGASMWVACVVGANTLLTGLTVPDFPGQLISGRVADLSSGIALILAFLVVKLIRSRTRRATLGGNIALWVSSGVLASFAPILVSLVFAGQVDEVLLAAFPIGLIASPALVAYFALLISGLLGVRRTSRDLARERKALLAMRDSMAEVVSDYESQLASEIESTLSEGLDAIIDKSPQSKNENRERLILLVESVVRPLSWRLEQSSDDVAILSRLEDSRDYLAQSPRRIRLGDSQGVYRTNLYRLVSPVWVAAAFALFDLPFTWFFFGFPGLCAGVIATALIFIGLRILRRVGAHQLVRRSTGVILQGAVSVVAAASFPIMVTLTIGPDVFALAPMIPALMLGMGMSLFGGFVARSVDAFEEARLVNEGMLELVARFRLETRELRKRLSRIVHGQVQSQLVALSIQSARGSRVVTEDDIRVVMAEALHQPSQLEPLRENRTFNNEIEDLRVVWGTVCTIDVEGSQHVFEMLEADPVAAACTIEVMRECAVNAVKHGKSDQIDIELMAHHSHAVQIVARNIVTEPIDEASSRGYGSKIMSDVTSRWSVKVEDHQFVMTAIVPLSRV